MIRLSKQRTLRVLSVHGWTGVLLGLALYVVVLTGAVAVFAPEIGLWSVSGSPVKAPLTESIDAHIRPLIDDVPKEYQEDTSIFHNPAGELIVFFHTHEPDESGRLQDKGVRFRLDPSSGAILERDEGFLDAMPDDPNSALEHFLVELHVNLHAPDPWGLYLTGILGLVLLVSGVSGVILHRHLLKDIFLSPRSSNKALNSRDKHNLAGTWALPFTIILALTGAFFSFAFSLGLPVIATTAFGGDQEKFIETLVGVPEKADDSQVPLANLDAMLKQSEELTGNEPIFVSIMYWGRADAKVLTFHWPHDGDIHATQHNFDGATGKYLGTKPRIGKIPSTGDTLLNLITALHFGNFAGWLSKMIWFALGLAVCYVTLSGLQLWVVRRENEPQWSWMAQALPLVGYGLPIALAVAAIGFMTAQAIGLSPSTWTHWGFVLGAAGVAFYALKKANREHYRYLLKRALGVLMVSLPCIRGVLSGELWFFLLDNGNAWVIFVDISLLFGGAYYLRLARRSQDLAGPRYSSAVEAR